MKFKNIILLFIFSGLLIICNIVLNKEVMETIISLVSVLCNFATLLIRVVRKLNSSFIKVIKAT